LEIAKLFAREGTRGIGVVGGLVSGGKRGVSLVIRDFDSLPAYDEWRSRNPRLAADAPTSITRRGRHVFLRVHGRVRSRKLAEGELIGESRFAVVPPSRFRPSRDPEHVYRWEKYPPLGISDFPLLALIDTGFLADGPRSKERQEESEEEHEEGKKKKNGMCPSLNMHEPTSPVIREAILRTLPRRSGERNERLLHLARSLKDLMPNATAGEIHPIVFSWFRRALSVIETTDWSETWRDFRWAWQRAAIPISRSLPMKVMSGAAWSAKDAGADSRDTLLAACVAMSSSIDGSFHLSVRTAANIVGLGKTRAWELLHDLVNDGSLVLVAPGSRGSTARNAAIYRVRGLR
jgi:hypothetical protein